MVVYDVILIVQEMLDAVNRQTSQYARYRQEKSFKSLIRQLSGQIADTEINDFVTARDELSEEEEDTIDEETDDSNLQSQLELNR